MELTGAQIVVNALKKAGVDTVFGYPGGQALPLYDALYDSGIRHILTRHEQGAVHAADGYARATGKVGVCISTSGPGATNLITGIATANMDSVPLVCITCQVPRVMIGKDSFQEADIVGITTPITKHNFLLRQVEQLPRVIAKAFHIAASGRPGPVVIDIPKNIQVEKTTHVEATEEELHMKGYRPLYAGREEDVQAVVNALRNAKKPLFFIGGGLVSANMTDAFRHLAEKTGIPVVASLMGLSGYPTREKFHLGMPGMHGTYAANMAITECDLLLGLGVRFDDRVTGEIKGFAPHAQIAHFDVDVSEINKNVHTPLRVPGDLAWSLPLFANLAEVNPQGLQAWQDQVMTWKLDHPLPYPKNATGLLKPQEVIKAIDGAKEEDAIVVTDVGQHQMWTAQYCNFQEPRSFITSGGLGTMGYGLPAAIGAQLAKPGKEVWMVSGDGSIMMNCQEIATASEYELPIKVVILNNRGLGMVRQWQRMFFGNRYSGSKHEKGTDFARLAEAMDAKGIKVEKREDLAKAITEAKNCPGPIFLDVRVEDDENVLPMVVPGATIDHMTE